MKLNPIRAAFLDGIRRIEDIIPLNRSGMLSKEEAVSTLKRLFPIERSYNLLSRFINHEIIEAKDDWMRDTALEWVKVSFDAVEITVTNGIFTAEEIKPLIFMHLTRMFNIEERLMGTAYEEAGYVLKRLEDKGYLTTREVDTFLNSVFLMRSDVKAYFNETELSMS